MTKEAGEFAWTPKRKQFCREFLVDLNQTQAAIRAGFSPKTARSTASQLMQMPEILAEIQQQMDKRAVRTKISADDVLQDLRDLADMCLGRSTTAKSVLVEGVPMDFKTTEVNPVGAARALELLGKHLKLFTDKVEHSGIPTVVIKDFTRGGANG